jgi:hypothetical protein
VDAARAEARGASLGRHIATQNASVAEPSTNSSMNVSLPISPFAVS